MNKKPSVKPSVKSLPVKSSERQMKQTTVIARKGKIKENKSRGASVDLLASMLDPNAW